MGRGSVLRKPEKRKIQSPEGLDCDPAPYACLRGVSVEGFSGGGRLDGTSGTLSITLKHEYGGDVCK